ncbi:MAG TPA: hypothetical protein VG737_05685 [Cyclobacteriaceae bacterium]|nr:hypothetical protein [Cyclobacteriaceae bacterium]
MKNLHTALCTAFVVVVAVSLSNAQNVPAAAQGGDFRGSNWGDSEAKVKVNEKCNMLSEEEGRLIYNCPLMDSEGKVVYTFTTNDKLMRAKYFLTPDYFNMIFYIRDFRMYEEILTKKYGRPDMVIPKVISKQAISEDEWATFLSAGELFVEAKWTKGKTEVRLTLSKTGPFPAIQIDYISLEMTKEDHQARLVALEKDL